jgi:hypothetical protein
MKKTVVTISKSRGIYLKAASGTMVHYGLKFITLALLIQTENDMKLFLSGQRRMAWGVQRGRRWLQGAGPGGGQPLKRA